MGKQIKNIDGKTFWTPITKNQHDYDSEPAEEPITHSMLTIKKLVPFRNHPFKLYTGQRLTDLVESIRAGGVFSPIIVRPIADKEEKHEILSGHNRVEAAKAAGLELIPGIIRKGLTDEEALLIVTETNLIQRSFADLPHSERALALATHYNAMKKKSGYRSDLLREVDELSCAPLGHRSKTRDKVAELNGLSKTQVARYLRINKLIPELKDRLDNDMIGMRIAEALSFLRDNEQKMVDDLLAGGMKISIKQADTLKAKSQSTNGKLDKASIKSVLEPGFFTSKVKPVKLSGKFLSPYFNENQSTEDIESVIGEALERYFSS